MSRLRLLFAGADGLDDYRRIAPLLRLPPGGVACVEIGATQAAAVSALFEAAGLITQVKADLAGRDRCVIVTPACVISPWNCLRERLNGYGDWGVANRSRPPVPTPKG